MKKKSKVLIFKVASSKIIGSGHVYRCLKIAERIKTKKIYFLTNNFRGNFNILIKRFKIHIINNNENNFNIKKDLDQTIEFLKSFNEEKILIMDNYFHNKNYQKKITKYLNKLVIINDNLKKNFCDIYINENFFLKHQIKKYF